jgi:hypothetical protein
VKRASAGPRASPCPHPTTVPRAAAPRRCPAAAAHRPLRLLTTQHVPLSAEQEQRAVDALAGLFAALIARHGGVGPVLEVHPEGEVSSAETATPTEGQPC